MKAAYFKIFSSKGLLGAISLIECSTSFFFEKTQINEIGRNDEKSNVQEKGIINLKMFLILNLDLRRVGQYSQQIETIMQGQRGANQCREK